jgi:hypothetical protein
MSPKRVGISVFDATWHPLCQQFGASSAIDPFQPSLPVAVRGVVNLREAREELLPSLRTEDSLCEERAHLCRDQVLAHVDSRRAANVLVRTPAPLRDPLRSALRASISPNIHVVMTAFGGTIGHDVRLLSTGRIAHCVVFVQCEPNNQSRRERDVGFLPDRVALSGHDSAHDRKLRDPAAPCRYVAAVA